MQYVIRAPFTSDVDAIVEIEESCFSEPWDSETFLVLCARSGKVGLREKHAILLRVIEIDGHGVIGYIVWEEDIDSLTGRVMNIAIRKKNQRQGLGEALIEHVFQELRQRGILECTLEARESNIPARCLYEKIGMRRSGKRVAYYGDREDAVVFTIDLFPRTTPD